MRNKMSLLKKFALPALAAAAFAAMTATPTMTALSRDAKFLFPDSDAGRDQILAYLNKLIADTRGQMVKLSAMSLKAPVLVKRVPPDIQDGAPQGYMYPGSLDGSRPSIYYINLKHGWSGQQGKQVQGKKHREQVEEQHRYRRRTLRRGSLQDRF